MVTNQKKKQNNKKGKISPWKVFALFLLVVQVVLSIVAMVIIVQSKMLAPVYLLVLLVGMWLLLFLAFVLMMLTRKRKGQDKSVLYGKRGLGTTLSIFSIILCILITSYVGKLNQTLNKVTVDQTVITNTIGVYVLADSSAQTLADLKDASFGVVPTFDTENTQMAIADINSKMGSEITMVEYDSIVGNAEEGVSGSVDGLLNGSVDAIILNESYEGVIDSVETYANFSETTRIVYEFSIETIVEAEEEEPVDVNSDTFIIYLSGSDTRSVKLATSRSDVNIMAVVNPVEHQVLLLSTPRDSFIPTTASASGSKDKLTHCGVYGIDCSMETLENYYDAQIDYYAQINFTGFVTLVDAVGGIDVESEKSFTTTHGGDKINQGMNHLNGSQALGFVRERYAFSDGDFARGRNEMRAVSALADKLTSPTILTKYNDIMNSLSGMFVTDMSSDEIATIVRKQESDLSSWDIRSYSVTGSCGMEYTYSSPKARQSVVYPDQASVDKAKALIQKMENGERLTDEDFQ